MDSSSAANPLQECSWCGEWHKGFRCPLVHAIEYYETGTIKRVEFSQPFHYSYTYPANFQWEGGSGDPMRPQDDVE